MAPEGVFFVLLVTSVAFFVNSSSSLLGYRNLSLRERYRLHIVLARQALLGKSLALLRAIYLAFSIPTRKTPCVFRGSTAKEKTALAVFSFAVLPVGIEPTLQLPQSCVLSIERRKHKRTLTEKCQTDKKRIYFFH